jgi:hypothetical protein
LFIAGALPACVVVAVLDTRWYGSPLGNGYGPLEYLYSWKNLWPNVVRYSRWLLDAQTPAALLAVIAPFHLWRRLATESATHERRAVTILLVMLIAGVVACYMLYTPFDAWWYLRFLLPAFPPLFVLMSVGLVSVATRLTGGLRNVAIAVILGVLGSYGMIFARDHSVFDVREGERKYVAMGQYIGRRLPERAAFLSMQHSGSIRYYSGRLTVRYDRIPEAQLDAAIRQLQRLGYEPYILLEKFEMDGFRRRFEEHSQIAALDWPPVARLRHASDVQIYDPVHRPVAATEPRIVTEFID